VTAAKRIAPADNGGDSRNQRTSNPTTPILLPTASDFPARIRLTDHADAYLEKLSEAWTLGVIGLDRFQGGLLAIVLAVHENAAWVEANRLRERLARVEHEADLWYFVANNRGATPATFRAAQTSALWDSAVMR